MPQQPSAELIAYWHAAEQCTQWLAHPCTAATVSTSDPQSNYDQIKHSQIKHSQIKQSQIKHDQIKHDQIKHSQIKQSQIKHDQIKHDQIKHSQIKQSQIKQSQSTEDQSTQNRLCSSASLQPSPRTAVFQAALRHFTAALALCSEDVPAQIQTRLRLAEFVLAFGRCDGEDAALVELEVCMRLSLEVCLGYRLSVSFHLSIFFEYLLIMD
jgi:hypothetical protein